MANLPCSPNQLPLPGVGSPTIRQLARTLREGKAIALRQVTRRGDGARYQEVHCRSALHAVAGMPFAWALNPYRGCTHDCQYCYARRYHAQQLELGGDDFASVILVKANLIPVLRREVEDPAWRREWVAVGTATDGYQPVEGEYRLTRQALEVFHATRTPVNVVTKGPLVVRDVDVLADLSRTAGCRVYISVPCVDESIARRLEPGAASPLQRLRAVRTLTDAGVSAGVLMSPIVPGVTSRRSLLERTMKAIADHGARFVGCGVLHLEPGVREFFERWLAAEYPGLLDRYAHLYERGYVPASYRNAVHAAVSDLRRHHAVRSA